MRRLNRVLRMLLLSCILQVSRSYVAFVLERNADVTRGCFTGSSGAPKGCVITHENVVSCGTSRVISYLSSHLEADKSCFRPVVAGVMTVLGDLITPDARFIAYLPLAHIFEVRLHAIILQRRIELICRKRVSNVDDCRIHASRESPLSLPSPYRRS